MSYIVNQARVHSLTINGVNYTNSLVSWTVSDSSANRNGFIVTAGQLVLGSYSGGPDIDDYDRNNFRRGVPVILTMQKPDGSTYRHPRGLLYVISTSYEVEAEQLNVEIGCRLALAEISDDPSTTLGLVPIPLDPSQRQLGNVSASFASAGKYLYQDNQGNFVSGLFFDGDSNSGVAPGEWTSILGVTAVSAAPLAATGAIPDVIKLTYQYPQDLIATDEKGRIDTEEVTSYYFIDYPASLPVRQNGDVSTANPNGTLGNAGALNEGTVPQAPVIDPCGNTPPQPPESGQGALQAGYTLEPQALILPAIKYEISKTYYGGPGGQQDFSERTTYGPIVEANNQYEADLWAYCIGTWGSSAQPSGGCPLTGMEQAKLSYSTTKNFFGEANELVRQIDTEYVNLRSLAQPTDWRSGLNAYGVPKDFTYLPEDVMIRAVVRITNYYKDGNANVQDTTTYTTTGQAGSGISVGEWQLDAYNGVITREVRRSTSTATLDVAPDIVNTPSTNTVDATVELPVFIGRYVLPPAESGPYELEEQIPTPLLFEDAAVLQSAVNTYSDYLLRFVKGDALGIQIGEGLREDVAENWYPGMPFRYYDPKKGKVLALRMDATSWGVTGEESGFVTNGIWIGDSNGTVTLPENIVGASSVSDGGSIDPLTTIPNASTTAPPPVVVPPVINNETSVDNGTYAYVVNVHVMNKITALARNDNGVQPPPPEDDFVNFFTTMVAYVQGFVVLPGALLSTTTTGGIPISAGGTLVTSAGNVLDGDLFEGTNTIVVQGTVTTGTNVLLLLHMDGANLGTTFADSSTYNNTMTKVGDVYTDTALVKLGTASAAFGLSTSEYRAIETPATASQWNIGTSDWTVEFWNYSTDWDLYKAYICGLSGDDPLTEEIFSIWWTTSEGSGTLSVNYQNSAGLSYNVGVNLNGAIELNTWQFVVIQYVASDNLTVWVDGVVVGVFSFVTSTVPAINPITVGSVTNPKFAVGNSPCNDNITTSELRYSYRGHMDEFRFTKEALYNNNQEAIPIRVVPFPNP